MKEESALVCFCFVVFSVNLVSECAGDGANAK